MKKWPSIFLGLLLSNSACAYYKSYNGFYGGVNLGLIQSKVYDDYDTRLNWPQAFDINILSNSKLTDISGTVGLNLGYSALFKNNFAWGLEGRANFQSLKTLNEESIHEVNSMLAIERHTSAELKQDFAFLGKLGLVYNCKFLVYGLVGADWGKVNIAIDTMYEQNIGGMIVGDLQNESSQYEAGLLLGIGMEYFVSPCTTIGLEYDYVNYGTVNFENPMTGDLLVNGVPQVGSFITDNNRIKMQTKKIMLRFNYYFT